MVVRPELQRASDVGLGQDIGGEAWSGDLEQVRAGRHGGRGRLGWARLTWIRASRLARADVRVRQDEGAGYQEHNAVHERPVQRVEDVATPRVPAEGGGGPDAASRAATATTPRVTASSACRSGGPW